MKWTMSFDGRKRYLMEALAMCYVTLGVVGKPCTRLLDMQMAEITEWLISLGACELEAKAAIFKALTRKTP